MALGFDWWGVFVHRHNVDLADAAAQAVPDGRWDVHVAASTRDLVLTGRVPVHGAEAAAWAVTVALRPLWQSEAVQATAPGLVVRCGGRQWRTSYEHLIVLSPNRERWRPELTTWLTGT